MVSSSRRFLAVFALLLIASCSPPLESLAHDNLQDQVAKQSGGVIQLSRFSKTSSETQKIAGMTFYSVSWKARITLLSDIWKVGNGIAGFWSDFTIMTAQPGMWEAMMFGGTSKEFVKGAVIDITGISHIGLSEGKWDVTSSSVTSYQVMSNERSAADLAELQRKRDSADAAEVRKRQEQEQMRIAVEAEEAASMAAAQFTRDSTVALAREGSTELTSFDCEIKKKGMAEAFMIDSILVYRFIVLSNGLYRRPLHIRSTRNANWVTLPDNSRDTIWFDQLTSKPDYHRGGGSSLDRQITFKSENDKFSRIYCSGNRGVNRADSLQVTFAVFEKALQDWSEKFPTLIRW